MPSGLFPCLGRPEDRPLACRVFSWASPPVGGMGWPPRPSFPECQHCLSLCVTLQKSLCTFLGFLWGPAALGSPCLRLVQWSPLKTLRGSLFQATALGPVTSLLPSLISLASASCRFDIDWYGWELKETASPRATHSAGSFRSGPVST